MVGKSIAISFRASQEEADFLSRLEVESAKTPSEKLRWLIQMARLREAGATDPARQRDLLEEILRPALHRWRNAEGAEAKNSELLHGFSDWLIEAAVFFAMAASMEEGEDFLTRLEDGAADRMARLAETFLRLGVTKNAPCYSPGVVRDRIEPIVELARIIDQQTR